MHTGRIVGHTRCMGAPVGWDKSAQGPCDPLYIRDDDTSAGKGMTSAWFPTSEEIDRIANGAPIYLTIIGPDHPPVCMRVGPVPDEVRR